MIRHSTDIDMLVISLDQIASLIRGTGSDWIEAALSTALKRSIRPVCAVIAFADQQHVSLGREIDDDAGLDDLICRKDHAADDPLSRDGGAQPAAGIEKREIWRGG